jgi:phospholipid/cholesterol/gamma-HCH transport system substrate-binding protein
MKNTLETRLGLFVALVMLAAFFILAIIGGFEKFQRGLHLHAYFKSVQELKVGDRVKMAGVEVGKVEDIQITNSLVKVSMKLRANTPVKTDSVAAIKFAGLMGQSFVSLDFGSPDNNQLLEEGQYVNTVEQADISAIMQKLDNVASGIENLTKSFTGDKIDNLLGPITDFLAQNTGPLTDVIANVRKTSDQIAQGQGTVGRLVVRAHADERPRRKPRKARDRLEAHESLHAGACVLAGVGRARDLEAKGLGRHVHGGPQPVVVG